MCFSKTLVLEILLSICSISAFRVPDSSCNSFNVVIFGPNSSSRGALAIDVSSFTMSSLTSLNFIDSFSKIGITFVFQLQITNLLGKGHCYFYTR